MNNFDANRFTADFVSSMNAKDPRALLSHYADNVEIIDPTTPQPLRGKEGVRKNFEQWSKGFSDMEIKLRDVVQSGNKVALRYEGKGRNTGELELSPGEPLPATNKPIRLELAEFLTLDNAGKIVKDETIFDQVSMMVQLGLMPNPQQAGSEQASPGKAPGAPQRGR